MAEERQKTISYYFAGASLTFGLPLLILELLGLAYSLSSDTGSSTPWFNSIYLGLHLVSGIFSGVMVGRMSSDGWVRSGIITAFLAYLLQQIIYLIFYGSRVIGDIYVLVVILVGCLLGAFIGETYMKSKTEDFP